MRFVYIGCVPRLGLRHDCLYSTLDMYVKLEASTANKYIIALSSDWTR